LRVLVANELQHLIGRERVRLFQDSRNILRRGDEDAIFRQADGRNGATPFLRRSYSFQVAKASSSDKVMPALPIWLPTHCALA
jgi:hypothetical protein